MGSLPKPLKSCTCLPPTSWCVVRDPWQVRKYSYILDAVTRDVRIEWNGTVYGKWSMRMLTKICSSFPVCIVYHTGRKERGRQRFRQGTSSRYLYLSICCDLSSVLASSSEYTGYDPVTNPCVRKAAAINARPLKVLRLSHRDTVFGVPWPSVLNTSRYPYGWSLGCGSEQQVGLQVWMMMVFLMTALSCGFGMPTIIQDGVIVGCGDIHHSHQLSRRNSSVCNCFIFFPFLDLFTQSPANRCVLLDTAWKPGMSTNITEPCCANDLTKVYGTSIFSVLEVSVTWTEIVLKYASASLPKIWLLIFMAEDQ
jgi:hypothetical protein